MHAYGDKLQWYRRTQKCGKNLECVQTEVCGPNNLRLSAQSPKQLVDWFGNALISAGLLVLLLQRYGQAWMKNETAWSVLVGAGLACLAFVFLLNGFSKKYYHSPNFWSQRCQFLFRSFLDVWHALVGKLGAFKTK